MSMSIRSTTGTWYGDPNGLFLEEVTTIDGSTNTLTIEGKFSSYGIVYNLTGSFSLPTPSTSVQYFSLQITGAGTLQSYSDTTGNCLSVQTGNMLVLFSETIPANAVNDQAFTTSSEPVLD